MKISAPIQSVNSFKKISKMRSNFEETCDSRKVYNNDGGKKDNFELYASKCCSYQYKSCTNFIERLDSQRANRLIEILRNDPRQIDSLELLVRLITRKELSPKDAIGIMMGKGYLISKYKEKIEGISFSKQFSIEASLLFRTERWKLKAEPELKSEFKFLNFIVKMEEIIMVSDYENKKVLKQPVEEIKPKLTQEEIESLFSRALKRQNLRLKLGKMENDNRSNNILSANSRIVNKNDLLKEHTFPEELEEIQRKIREIYITETQKTKLVLQLETDIADYYKQKDQAKLTSCLQLLLELRYDEVGDDFANYCHLYAQIPDVADYMISNTGSERISCDKTLNDWNENIKYQEWYASLNQIHQQQFSQYDIDDDTWLKICSEINRFVKSSRDEVALKDFFNNIKDMGLHNKLPARICDIGLFILFKYNMLEVKAGWVYPVLNSLIYKDSFSMLDQGSIMLHLFQQSCKRYVLDNMHQFDVILMATIVATMLDTDE